jgi:hypothetical protein
MYNKLTNIYLRNVLLNEFTETAIRAFITKFQAQANSMTSEQEIRDNIVKFDKIKNSPRFLQVARNLYPNIKQPQDPTNYTYTEFEGVLNWFGDYKSAAEIPLLPEERPEAEPPVLYDDGTFAIYTAYTHEQARKLIQEILPQKTGKNFGYCVQDSSGYYWRSYRISRGQTFYFVVDSSLAHTANNNYVLVIRPTLVRQPDGSTQTVYNVSDARNYDRTESWENIITLQPKLENKKDLLVPRQFSRSETIQKDMGETVTSQTFSRMSYQSKAMFISLGRKIYAKDYVMLDKEMQNSYINARERDWEELNIADTKIEYFRLFYPFEVSDVSPSFMCVVLSFLYIKNEHEKILEMLPSIKNSSNSVIKRFFELLARYNKDILVKTYTPMLPLLPVLWSSVGALLRQYESSSRFESMREQIHALNNFTSKNSFADMLTEEEKKSWLTSSFFITRAQFSNLTDDLQKLYIDTWFNSNCKFKQITGVLEFQIKQTNVLDFLADSNTATTIWANILNYKDLPALIDDLPGISLASSTVKSYFLERLKAYSEN